MFEDSYIDQLYEDRYDIGFYGFGDEVIEGYAGSDDDTCPECGSTVYVFDDYSGEAMCENDNCGASLWWDDDAGAWVH